MVTASAEHVAYVHRTNGAYLIGFAGPLTDDVTPYALYDAAGSLRRARQVARAGAESFGYVGPFRWVDGPGYIVLTAHESIYS